MTEIEIPLYDLTPEIIADMKSIHFTADLHFGHDKIVGICNRPTTPENHNKWLTDEVWNRHVNRKDTVYIIGDLSFENKEKTDKILDKLHGKKFMVLGNHDKSSEKSSRFQQITQIKDFTYSKFSMNIHIVLCHYAIIQWNRKIHGSWHLFGHSHCRPLEFDAGLCFDVGIDREGWWRPYTLYDIYRVMHWKNDGFDTEEIMRMLKEGA